KGIWYAIFHSVSAFCNAGFDLMGEKERFSSLTAYSANATISITIMLLIMIGGIGFVTWDDIRVHKHHISRYRLQSKVTLLMTGVLIVLPTLYFYFVEFTRPVWKELSSTERLLDAFFMAVTPRTAGFNTVNLNQISEPGSAIIITLMLIGGSPGSTAGGMKTTTVFVLLVTSYTIFRRKEDTNCFGRRMMEDTIRNAATIMMMYLFLFLIGGILIGCIEDVPILNALFETASAIGTVGLTLGITPSLGVASRWILIVLMFLGRVGGLTLIYATIARKKSSFSRLPQEKITVG
ncbi:MAG TPA: potassium transporter TrkG, partial [Lachnospiraceae bacterium]|nr:potassium transporter TrkG [Lachnospiraceae bacterium]